MPPSNRPPLRATLLGPDIEHRRSLEAMLDTRCAVSWMPDSSSFFRDRPVTLARRLQRAFDQFGGTRDPAFRQALLRHLDEHRTEVVVAYWGTNPLADLLAIRQLRPGIRLVLMVLCYPLALDELGVRRQHWMLRRAAPHLDGVLFPSEAMRGHFQAHRLLQRAGREVADLVLPPCWPASFQPPLEADTPPAPASSGPNLIFVGRTDLSHPTIHAADDLRGPMRELLAQGIELHHVHSPETDDGHPLRRPFAPDSQTGLLARMARHDASLILYNTAACERADRFDLTVPDRLISSVAAGVPIALPARGYRAAHDHLADHPAVISFESFTDLARQLADRPRIAAMRQAAWQGRSRHAAEWQGPRLCRFLEELAPRPVPQPSRPAATRRDSAREVVA